MCPVAEGGFGSLFAATEEGGFAGFRSEFHWRESAAFVRTIAERLFGGLATRAPEIGFALFKVDFIGGGLSDFRDVGHGQTFGCCGVYRVAGIVGDGRPSWFGTPRGRLECGNGGL